MTAEKRQVVRCWHPAPVGELFHLAKGIHAEVRKGNAAYQISNGDIINHF